jgi:hypothetical protein
MEFAQDVGVLELVGHGHGVHEAGDGVVIERDGALGSVCPHNFAAEFVGLELLTGRD